MKRLILLTLCSGVLILLFGAVPAYSQDGAQTSAILSPHLGIVHISAPSDPIVEQRYRNALFLGAGWNRWALYWDSVEQASGDYLWNGYDQLIANDVRYGLHSDAIFLGIPAHQRDGSVIHGLYNAIFSDGSDTPGSGKMPNPDNAYARFVYAAVQRYKPGGTLAAQLGWRADQGVRVWEAWNEPDLRMFWSGSVEDYARLLKVTYMVVRQADPLAQVMFGGLAYNNPDVDDYLARTLAVITQDPQRGAFNWYFDIAAMHSYSSAERSGRLIKRMKQVLAAYGLDRPLWLNESGIPVWDDYPGQTWLASNPGARLYRGTMQEQAVYVVENTAIAWAAGADVVFFFQLYDDCGNQPAGTDFAPNSGQAGDAYGLFRNASGSTCFTHSPQPNTPRPAASAYYRMAQVFGSRQFDGGTRINLSGGASVISFDLSPTQGVAQFGAITSGVSTVSERATVLWNTSAERIVVQIPASGSSAQLYTITDDYMLTPQDGEYAIGLPPATTSDYPQLSPSELIHLSGAPLILVEPVTQGWTPVDPLQIHLEGAAPATAESPLQLTPTFGPIIGVNTPAPTPLPQPTVDPALDHAPPLPLMQPLPETSPPTFTVQWSALDNSGIDKYVVWVRIDDGDWQTWLETSDTQADYNGESGHSYEFALWAVDLAGNWSQNVELSAQAATMIP